MDSSPFTVEIISTTEDYLSLLQTVFDFPRIARLFSRPDFHFHFDAINGVSGAYAKPLSFQQCAWIKMWKVWIMWKNSCT